MSNTVLFVMDIKTDLYTISLFKMERRKRKELCLKENIDLIDASDGKSQRQLADLFGIGKTLVQAILKRTAQFYSTKC